MTIDAGIHAPSEYLTHPKYRADIDGLRAIAVLSVVGLHAFPDMIESATQGGSHAGGQLAIAGVSGTMGSAEYGRYRDKKV